MHDHVEHIPDSYFKAPGVGKVRDSVNHPSHYTGGPVECIDAIRAALGEDGFRFFLRGQVLKYIWRGPHKGAEAQDYAKANWYLQRLIEATP